MGPGLQRGRWPVTYRGGRCIMCRSGGIWFMDGHPLDGLSPETLKKLALMYAANWQTLDGLWFGSVEAEYGLDAAVRLDLRNWQRQAAVEAQRIKEVLNLGPGLGSVLTAVRYMSWQLVSPPFQVESREPGRVVFYYPRCPVQEGRRKRGKPEFPCQPMKLGLFTSVAGVIEPRARVSCISCPPDMHPETFWCKWELRLV